MGCGTVLPRTCSAAVAICGQSRNCWGTPACRRRSAIPRSRPSGCWRFTTRRIRARDRPAECRTFLSRLVLDLRAVAAAERDLDQMLLVVIPDVLRKGRLDRVVVRHLGAALQ